MTKTIRVKKSFTFRELLKKINESAGDGFVSRLRIMEDYIDYIVINSNGEEVAEVTLVIQEDSNCIVPRVNFIVVSVDKNEINFINKIKNLFEGVM